MGALRTVMEVAQLSSDVASLLADARSGKGLTLNQLQALQQIHQLKAWQQREAEPVLFQRHLLVSDVSRQSVSQAQSIQKENTAATEWSPLKEISSCSRGPQALDEVPSVSKCAEQLQDPYSHACSAASSHHTKQNTADFSGAVAVAEELCSVRSDSCESLMSADSLYDEQPHTAAAGEVSLGVGGLGSPSVVRGDDRPIHPGLGVGSGCGTFEEMLEKQLQKHQAEVSVQTMRIVPEVLAPSTSICH